ncbi:hypothetical protein WJX75_009193 [Coccomyxa subellipsoidea]|uniref:ABM domain-containing protein n=1 Tax=Coccomyxa subellipsoidea TaxID=248742 RepID=A0ABR2YUJ9_9CHLO
MQLISKCISLRSCGSAAPCRQRGRLVVVAAVKKTTVKNVVCHKTLVAKQDQADKVAEMCKDILDFSYGKKSQKSNGIQEFVVSRDQFEPNVFYVWERYNSNADLGRHNSCTEYNAFMENIQEHLEGPIGMALYEWKDGKIGNVCVQGGPKGEGGLDDATGAGGTGASNMKQTSAVVNLGDVNRGGEGDSFGMGFKFPWQKK